MKTNVISFAVGVAALMLSMGAYSRNPKDATQQTSSSGEGESTSAVTYTSYDSSSLTEVRSLTGFPDNLSALLGWHRKGDGGTGPDSDIVNAGEDFHPTDVVGGRPSRRFVVGGLSTTSALVAYEEGGWGSRYFAAAYVRGKSGWALVARWRINWATTLREVQSQTSKPPDK
jgi:hypothetical protein